MKTWIVLAALMSVALALPALPALPAQPIKSGVASPPRPNPVRVDKDDLRTDETAYLASAYSGFPAYSAYTSLSGGALPSYPAYAAYSGLPAIQPIAAAPIAYIG